MIEWNLKSLWYIILHCTIPGLAAGIALFIYAYSRNYYKNNKYFIKLIVELIGAAITATFIAIYFNDPLVQITIAFCVGLSWVRILQLIRKKITKVIEVILGDYN